MTTAFFACLLLADPFIVDGRDLTASTPAQLHELADEYWHKGDYKTVVALLDRVIELDPGDVDAYGICAWLIWSGRDDPQDPNHMGLEPDARKYLERCVIANPDSAEAYWEMGFHLMDRLGDAAGALPWLRRGMEENQPLQQAGRTYAHALFFGEYYSEAAAFWQKLYQRGQVPLGVADINRNKALRRARQPDALLRSGGVIDGPADPAKAARVLRDLRYDDDQNGSLDRRVVTLDLADDRDGEADVRIVYQGRPATYRYYWLWREIAWDSDDSGQFDGEALLRDDDLDGVADGDLSLEALQRRRESLPSPLLRRALAPDVFWIGRSGDGRLAPIAPRAEGNGLVLEPTVTVCSADQPIELRLLLGKTVAIERQPVASVPLPAGAYTTGVDGGPTCRLELRPDPRIAPGRWFVQLELWVQGLLIGEWTTRDNVAVVAADKVTWENAVQEDLTPTPPPLVPGATRPDLPPVPGPPGFGDPPPPGAP